MSLTVKSVCCVRYVWIHYTRGHSATVIAGKLSYHSNGAVLRHTDTSTGMLYRPASQFFPPKSVFLEKQCTRQCVYFKEPCNYVLKCVVWHALWLRSHIAYRFATPGRAADLRVRVKPHTGARVDAVTLDHLCERNTLKSLRLLNRKPAQQGL